MIEHSKKVITRFAPSPTGDPHIGSLRNALYNWLFARQANGKFLLRIEDTDRERYVETSEQTIIASLKWASLDYDSQVIRQSERKTVYQKYAKQLVESGKAYCCFCEAAELDRMRKEQQARNERPRYDGRCRNLPGYEVQKKIKAGTEYVVRLKIPESGETKVEDIVRGEVVWQNSELDDLVILKSDGYPTYHLAHLVDDHESGVTHVIRGEEWLPSLPKHSLLYAALSWSLPRFAHLPLILAKDKSKLSKRHGAVSVLDFKTEGYLPEALLNFVLLLGWHPKLGSKQEIFTKNEMLAQFKLEDVQKSGAIFDYQKLDSLNAIYIRQTPISKLTDLARPFFTQQSSFANSDELLTAAIVLEKDRIKKLAELPAAVLFISELPNYDPEKLIWKKSTKAVTQQRLETVKAVWVGISENDWHKETLENILTEKIKTEKLGTGETLWPTRVAVSGQVNSPGPFEIAAVLGKAEALRRINIALEKLRKR